MTSISLPQHTIRWCRTLAIIAILSGLGFGVVLFLQGYPFLQLSQLSDGPYTLSGMPRHLAMIFVVILVGLHALIFIAIAQLFHILARGEVLTERMAVSVIRIGQAHLAIGVLTFLWPSVRAVLEAMSGGNAMLKVGIDSEIIMTLLIGAALLMLGRVFRIAISLAEENRQFV